MITAVSSNVTFWFSKLSISMVKLPPAVVRLVPAKIDRLSAACAKTLPPSVLIEPDTLMLLPARRFNKAPFVFTPPTPSRFKLSKERKVMSFPSVSKLPVARRFDPTATSSSPAKSAPVMRKFWPSGPNSQAPSLAEVTVNVELS